MKKLIFAVSVFALIAAGCTESSVILPEDPDTEVTTPPGDEKPDEEPPLEDEEGDLPPPVEVGPYDGERADDAAADTAGSDEDIYWEANSFKTTVRVTFCDDTAEVESSSKDVLWHAEGAHVVVDMLTNSVKNTEIIVSGSTADGSLKIYGEKKFKLTLDGAEIVSKRGPAINNQCKKRVFVHLAADKTNRLCDAKTYSDDFYYPSGVAAADEDRKGCFFSEGHLIFSGTGVLVVEGRRKHAIATDDTFVMRPGVTLVVADAADNGIHVKGDSDDGSGITVMGGLIHATVTSEAGKCLKTDENVAVSGGRLLLKTTGSAVYEADSNDTSSPAGIKADGNILISGGKLQIESTGLGGKGISADGDIRFAGGTTEVNTSGGKYVYNSRQDLESSPKGIKADGNIVIDDGTIDVSVVGASDGSEGIESKSVLTINGGTTTVYAYDDAINASTGVVINGGHVYAYAINNDGIDSNGYLYLNGGTVVASGAAAPEEAFDCDYSNSFIVTGGTLVGVAGAAISPSTSATTQRTLIYNGISISKESVLAVVDAQGKAILLYTVPRTLNNGTTLFFSSAAMAQGATYTVYKDVTVSGGECWCGLYENASWSGGTQVGTFTTTSMITTVGNSTGPGGGGPGGGGPGGGWRP